MANAPRSRHRECSRTFWRRRLRLPQDVAKGCSTTDICERRLGRVATVGKDGTPHVAPVGWSYNDKFDTIDVGGRQFDQSKKYRDVKRCGRAAIVIDDLASVDPWRPRGVEVRGRADVVDDPSPMIRIHPDRVVSWGLDANPGG
jgi:pyridoxamine 5'-phosphate oxidase family protein